MLFMCIQRHCWYEGFVTTTADAILEVILAANAADSGSKQNILSSRFGLTGRLCSQAAAKPHLL